MFLIIRQTIALLFFLNILLVSKYAEAQTSAADEVFQSKNWKYEFNSQPTEDSYSQHKRKKNTDSRSGYQFYDEQDTYDKNENYSQTLYLSRPSLGFMTATDSSYIFDGNIGGYFDISLALGGSSYQGGGAKIASALKEIGGAPITFGVHLAYLRSISGDQKLHLGGGLLIVGSRAERETPNYKEEFSYNDFILAIEAKYCLNYDPAYGAYLRAGAGLSGKSWNQKRSNELIKASRSDSSVSGLSSFVGLGYAGSLYDTHWPLYAEFSTAFTNSEGPAHLGSLPSTHFLFAVGMQFH